MRACCEQLPRPARSGSRIHIWVAHFHFGVTQIQIQFGHAHPHAKHNMAAARKWRRHAFMVMVSPRDESTSNLCTFFMIINEPADSVLSCYTKLLLLPGRCTGLVQCVACIICRVQRPTVQHEQAQAACIHVLASASTGSRHAQWWRQYGAQRSRAKKHKALCMHTVWSTAMRMNWIRRSRACGLRSLSGNFRRRRAPSSDKKRHPMMVQHTMVMTPPDRVLL